MCEIKINANPHDDRTRFTAAGAKHHTVNYEAHICSRLQFSSLS